MTQPSQTPNQIPDTTEDFRLLGEFLTEHSVADASDITALTPDASTRRYYRVPWKGGATAIVALHPELFDPATLPFLDITDLFKSVGLPVPNLYAIDAGRGIIAQEDMSDRQLRDALAASDAEGRERLLKEAIRLIARIQAATELAIERNSIASRLAFDEEKLLWELNYFVQHYFGSLRGRALTDEETGELNAEMTDIARDLAARPRVLCHRDFHASNLIVDQAGDLRVIDYQDARMGPATYDLVSILLDRRREPPADEEVAERRLFFLEERRRVGLEAIDADDFAREFRLMTVQRCLKAAGTFAFQTAIRNRGEVYGEFLRPMLLMSLQAAEWLDRFPRLRRLLASELNS